MASCGNNGATQLPGAPTGVVVHAGGGDSINTFRLDPATGGLKWVGRQPAGDDARLVEVDVGRTRAWVQTEVGRPLSILTFALGPGGTLTRTAEHPLPFPDVEGVTQMSRHPHAPWLLISATNASAGLEDQLMPIGNDGRLGAALTISREFYAFTWDRSGGFFYGLDGEAIFQHRFDRDSGALAPLDPPTAPGSSGRTVLGLIEHADAGLFLSVEETQIAVWARDAATGALTARSQAGNPVPSDPLTWSALHLHANGRVLYAVGFLTGPRTLLIDVFALDPATGALTFLERETGDPRHQVISTGLQAPLVHGDWLLVGGQGTSDELWGRATLAVYRIGADGTLAPSGGVAPLEPAETARVNFVFAP